jgi:hemolysin III
VTVGARGDAYRRGMHPILATTAAAEMPAARRGMSDRVSGYTHLAGLVLAALGALALLSRAWAHPPTLVTTGTYAACMLALYAASSAYHLAPADDALVARLRKLDHGAIFLMIAGTCTPIFFRAFDGAVRAAMLGTVWGAALVGIVLRVAWMGAPRALYTVIYVAMGWLVVVQGPRALAALPASVVALVCAGGLTYTLGALVYALRRPDPFPRVLGFHAIWHLFVLAGSAFHYGAIFVLVAG